MTDEEMAERYANENKIIFEYQGMSDFVWQELKEACLAGLKAGRQGQSGIGWIDTAHIEVKLHDAVENIKKQLDSIAQEILGGNHV